MGIRNKGVLVLGKQVAQQHQKLVLVLEEFKIFLSPAELKLVLGLGQGVHVA